MKVTKERSSMFPKTTQYTVDPEEGDYTYTVLVGKDAHPTAAGQIICAADNGDCAHVLAVREFLAGRR